LEAGSSSLSTLLAESTRRVGAAWPVAGFSGQQEQVGRANFASAKDSRTK
jgi:hypothetical protein